LNIASCHWKEKRRKKGKKEGGEDKEGKKEKKKKGYRYVAFTTTYCLFSRRKPTPLLPTREKKGGERKQGKEGGKKKQKGRRESRKQSPFYVVGF